MSESKTESKDGESKDDFKGDLSGNGNKSLVDCVQEFCSGCELEKEFEDFAEEYSQTFVNAAEFKDNDEHPLEFYDVYKEYLRRFERKIENFILKEGYSVEEFYKECRRILDDEDVFGSRRFFIETLLATSEYEYFFILMKGEMSRINDQRNKK